WADAEAVLARAAQGLEAAGADVILIGANTMHRVAEGVQAAVDVPLLHIADATAQPVRAAGGQRRILPGTRYPLEQELCTGRLRDRHGIDALVPDAGDRAMINRVIFEQLCRGQVHDDARRGYLRAVETLRTRGGDAVVLACTEIGLLIGPDDVDLPVLDTARIHAAAAVDF